MSHFFQRLAQQSGIRVPDAPRASPPPVAALVPRPATAPVETAPAVADLMEVHEERIIDPAARTVVSRTTPSDSRATKPSTPGTEVSVTSEATPAVSPPPTVVRESETLLIRDHRSDAPRAPTRSPAPVSALPTTEIPPPTPAPAPAAQTPAVDPNHLMQAVMNWIAAGSPQTSTPPRPSTQPATPAADGQNVSHAETAPSAPAAVEPRPATPIPERVIKLVERATEVPRPSEPARTIAPLPRRELPATAPTPPEPVQVSIGSISVRVEAPAAAPAKAVAPVSRPAPARREPTPKPRTSRFSQLRRHYIIPH